MSRMIHDWIIHQHKLRLGTEHPKCTVGWKMHLVTDDSAILGNSKQFGLDCGLHACAAPIFIANGGKEINFFGTNDEERQKAGIEMRRRMILSLSRNEFLFKPAPGL